MCFFIETNLKKYGTKCTLSVPEFKQKAHQTMIKRYGHAYPIQNDELKNKILDNRAETLNQLPSLNASALEARA